MNEMIDVLDPLTGKKTGESILLYKAHEKGIWHESVHIHIVNRDKTKVLLQKRCDTMRFYPGMWDISVGGHVSAGEDAIFSARREIWEELGIDSDKLKINKIGRITEKLINDNIISNEYVSIFIVYANININDIKKQVDEVSDVMWCTKSEFNKLILEGKMVPHDYEFNLLNSILK